MTTSLPPTDPLAPDDKLPGEAELAALYRQLPRNEPGPALDAAVLRAAAQALEGESPLERRKAPHESGDEVHPKPLSTIPASQMPSTEANTRTRRRPVPHWVVGLSSAASLVLVAGLAWHMREMPRPDSKAVATADATDTIQAPAAGIPRNQPDAGNAERSNLASSIQSQAPVPMKPKKQASHLPPAALPDLKPVAPDASGTEAVPYKLSNKPIEHDDAATMEATRRAVLQKRATSAPKQPASADKASAVGAPPLVMEAVPPAPPASMLRQDHFTAADPGDTPEQELAKIELLVQQDREIEAKQRLQIFHRAYPQWSLPTDLRGLLDKP